MSKYVQMLNFEHGSGVVRNYSQKEPVAFEIMTLAVK